MKSGAQSGWCRAILGLSALAIVSVGSIGCKSSGSSDPYWRAWYDVYGNYCYTGYASAGCNFYWDGVKIVDVEDPYFWDSYALDLGVWYYIDSFSFSSVYAGWAWLSPTGILYDEWGNALNEEEGDDDREWSAAGAEKEEEVIRKAGLELAERMALNDENTGIEIAQTLNSWATLVKGRKSRTRTYRDVKATGKLLHGVDVDAALKVIATAQSLNDEKVEKLNQQVAEYWGTTPETSREVLVNWYDDQLSELGLK